MMLATILTTSILATGALTLGWFVIVDILHSRLVPVKRDQ